MKNLIKMGIICLAFSLAMLVFATAATPREMYENGVVSDDGIRLGDARDGEVSDVSEGSDIFNGEGTGMLGDMMDGTDKVTNEHTSAAPSTTKAPATGTANDGEGIGMGVIIAVLVVIAVIVIIFLLLPKRR